MKRIQNNITIPANLKINIIDIGARWGINPPWNNINKEIINYYGFEPDIIECNKLNILHKGKNIKYFPIALSDKESTATLHITNEPGSSSLLKPNLKLLEKFYLSNNWEISKEVNIETTKLSKILFDNKINPEFIKIDVQGLAFEVLKGMGDNQISNTLFFEIECEYNEMYCNQYLFNSIFDLMNKNGFILIDVCNYHAKNKILPYGHSTKGQLMFADTFYIKNIDLFYSDSNISNENFPDRVWKTITILAIYGYYDIALEFALHIKSPLSTKEQAYLEKEILYLTKISTYKLILFNNIFIEKLGRFISLLGNSLQIKSRTFGWFSEKNSINSRFKNDFKFKVYSYLFRK